MRVIGLAGRKQSGKGSVATALVRDLGFVELSFASALKDFTAKVFDWPREKLDDAIFKETIVGRWKGEGDADLTPRLALQRIGVAAREVFGEDFWVERVVNRLEKAQGTDARFVVSDCRARFVVSDCRFWNELRGLRQWGSPVTKIVRLNRADRTERHDFVRASDDRCGHNYMHGSGGFETTSHRCGLPSASHPTSWTPDRHESETQLPDLDRVTRVEGTTFHVYDAVFESASGEEQAKKVLEYVAAFMKGKKP